MVQFVDLRKCYAQTVFTFWMPRIVSSDSAYVINTCDKKRPFKLVLLFHMVTKRIMRFSSIGVDVRNEVTDIHSVSVKPLPYWSLIGWSEHFMCARVCVYVYGIIKKFPLNHDTHNSEVHINIICYLPLSFRRNPQKFWASNVTCNAFSNSIIFLLPHCHLWADRLENVGDSVSHNPAGLHGLLQG
jgi:hypothetical protein